MSTLVTTTITVPIKIGTIDCVIMRNVDLPITISVPTMDVITLPTTSASLGISSAAYIPSISSLTPPSPISSMNDNESDYLTNLYINRCEYIITPGGSRCKKLKMRGSEHCSVHAKITSRCSYPTSKGSPCTKPKVTGTDYCAVHNRIDEANKMANEPISDIVEHTDVIRDTIIMTTTIRRLQQQLDVHEGPIDDITSRQLYQLVITINEMLASHN